jgi:tRNA threonylcarbamoyladenosine biosynthesis protein TsaB
MNILSLDTSSKIFSLAILKAQTIVATHHIQPGKVLSDFIIPAFQEIIKKSTMTLEHLDGFVVGLGPGSFTSLRVGVASAKALAFACQKPLIGWCSLDAMAMNADERAPYHLCVIGDAKRNLVYVRRYGRQKQGKLKPLTPCCLVDIHDAMRGCLEDTLFIGDGIKIFHKEIKKHFKKINKVCLFAPEEQWLPRAEALGLLALPQFFKKTKKSSVSVVPMYLYKDDCQVRK